MWLTREEAFEIFRENVSLPRGEKVEVYMLGELVSPDDPGGRSDVLAVVTNRAIHFFRKGLIRDSIHVVMKYPSIENVKFEKDRFTVTWYGGDYIFEPEEEDTSFLPEVKKKLLHRIKPGKKKLTERDVEIYAVKELDKIKKNIDEKDAEYVLDHIEGKIERLPSSLPEKFLCRVKLLWKMLRDAMDGKYEVPWKIIVVIIAALIYFINPFDIVPDFIPGIGYIDDATVIALVIETFHSEIERYREWKGLPPC
ncbi:hypothetical protein DRQ18_00025 [bacterium]|nr:MAG: hypothetical protein DRQ18_00025 [bacterium]